MKKTPLVVDLDDTGSSVYPEARPNPWSHTDEPDTKRYIFGDNYMDLLNRASEIIKSRRNK